MFHFLSSFYVFELLIQIESKTHIAIESSDLNMKCVLPCSSITWLNTTCVYKHCARHLSVHGRWRFDPCLALYNLEEEPNYTSGNVTELSRVLGSCLLEGKNPVERWWQWNNREALLKEQEKDTLKKGEWAGPEVATASRSGYLFFSHVHRLWIIARVVSDWDCFQSPEALFLPVGRGSFWPYRVLTGTIMAAFPHGCGG